MFEIVGKGKKVDVAISKFLSLSLQNTENGEFGGCSEIVFVEVYWFVVILGNGGMSLGIDCNAIEHVKKLCYCRKDQTIELNFIGIMLEHEFAQQRNVAASKCESICDDGKVSRLAKSSRSRVRSVSSCSCSSD